LNFKSTMMCLLTRIAPEEAATQPRQAAATSRVERRCWCEVWVVSRTETRVAPASEEAWRWRSCVVGSCTAAVGRAAASLTSCGQMKETSVCQGWECCYRQGRLHQLQLVGGASAAAGLGYEFTSISTTSTWWWSGAEASPALCPCLACSSRGLHQLLPPGQGCRGGGASVLLCGPFDGWRTPG
jgi:hypothetical protein